MWIPSGVRNWTVVISEFTLNSRHWLDEPTRETESISGEKKTITVWKRTAYDRLTARPRIMCHSRSFFNRKHRFVWTLLWPGPDCGHCTRMRVGYYTLITRPFYPKEKKRHGTLRRSFPSCSPVRGFDRLAGNNTSTRKSTSTILKFRSNDEIRTVPL